MHKLYVMVDTTSGSMDPGKAMAHSGHAANKAVFEMNKSSRGRKLVQEWQGGLGFGTQINVFISFDELDKFLESLPARVYGNSGVVVDPSYPMVVPNDIEPFLDWNKIEDAKTIGDGKLLLTVFKKTAAYVFVSDSDKETDAIMKQLPLAK